MNMPQENINSLFGSSSYLEFLNRYINAKKIGGRSFSYAALARRSGFASRGFVRDVVKGKKKIVITSVENFIRGMGLTGDLAQYFRCLVEIEAGNQRLESRSAVQLHKRMNSLRNRALKKNNSKLHEPGIVFKKSSLPFVYSALGSKNNGATKLEIISRTNLKEDEIIGALEFLKNKELVIFKNKKYFAVNEHLVEKNLSNQSFKNFWNELMRKANHKALSNFESRSDLFFGSCFSVKRNDLPKLKEELRSVLLQYVDDAENPDGDHITSMVCALF